MIIVECEKSKCQWNEDGCCLKSDTVNDLSDIAFLPCVDTDERVHCFKRRDEGQDGRKKNVHKKNS